MEQERWKNTITPEKCQRNERYYDEQKESNDSIVIKK